MAYYLYVPSRTEPGAMSQYDIDLAGMPCFSGSPEWALGMSLYNLPVASSVSPYQVWGFKH